MVIRIKSAHEVIETLHLVKAFEVVDAPVAIEGRGVQAEVGIDDPPPPPAKPREFLMKLVTSNAQESAVENASEKEKENGLTINRERVFLKSILELAEADEAAVVPPLPPVEAAAASPLKKFLFMLDEEEVQVEEENENQSSFLVYLLPHLTITLHQYFIKAPGKDREQNLLNMLGRDLIPCLKFLQKHELCHGNLHPSNIIVRSRVFILTNFEHAGFVNDPTGACVYAPPEYRRIQKRRGVIRLTLRAEAFALGCLIADVLSDFTFWDIISGTSPLPVTENPIPTPEPLSEPLSSIEGAPPPTIPSSSPFKPKITSLAEDYLKNSLPFPTSIPKISKFQYEQLLAKSPAARMSIITFSQLLPAVEPLPIEKEELDLIQIKLDEKRNKKIKDNGKGGAFNIKKANFETSYQFVSIAFIGFYICLPVYQLYSSLSFAYDYYDGCITSFAASIYPSYYSITLRTCLALLSATSGSLFSLICCYHIFEKYNEFNPRGWKGHKEFFDSTKEFLEGTELKSHSGNRQAKISVINLFLSEVVKLFIGLEIFWIAGPYNSVNTLAVLLMSSGSIGYKIFGFALKRRSGSRAQILLLLATFLFLAAVSFLLYLPILLYNEITVTSDPVTIYSLNVVVNNASCVSTAQGTGGGNLVLNAYSLIGQNFNNLSLSNCTPQGFWYSSLVSVGQPALSQTFILNDVFISQNQSSQPSSWLNLYQYLNSNPSWSGTSSFYAVASYWPFSYVSGVSAYSKSFSVDATQICTLPNELSLMFDFFRPSITKDVTISTIGETSSSSSGSLTSSKSYQVSSFSGNVTAGYSNGPMANASYNRPSGIALDSSKNVFIVDTSNHCIRKISGGVTSLFAGIPGVCGSNSTTFCSPTSVTVDSSGNVFVADRENHAIRKISQSGVIQTLAGSLGISGYTDGYSTLLNLPTGIQSFENILYFSDYGNNVIRAVDTTSGYSWTVAGSGLVGSSDGPSLSSSFYQPVGIAVSSKQVVYISDSGNHKIRVLNGTTVSTLAGGSSQGYMDGLALYSQFRFPYGVALNPTQDTLLVADTGNNVIRSISGGVVATIAGTSLIGSVNIERPPFSEVKFSPSIEKSHRMKRLAGTASTTATTRLATTTTIASSTTTASNYLTLSAIGAAATSASFSNPYSILSDEVGNILVADRGNNEIRIIQPLTQSGSACNEWSACASSLYCLSGICTVKQIGRVLTLSGSGLSGQYEGTSTTSSYSSPFAVAVDNTTGTIYISDSGSNLIRKISSSGVSSLLAGSGNQGSSNGVGGSASFYNPTGLVARNGTVYVVDGNNVIRQILSNGTVSTVTFSGSNNSPMGITIDPSTGNLIIADSKNGLVMRFFTSTLAQAFGPFNYPVGVVCSSDGTIYASDSYRHIIYYMNSNDGFQPIVLAGSGTPGSGNGYSYVASFQYPRGLALDSVNNLLYVADSGNHLIRVISLSSKEVFTVAGTAGVSGALNGVGTAATFNWPSGVALDNNGNLVVADTGNNLIRTVQLSL